MGGVLRVFGAIFLTAFLAACGGGGGSGGGGGGADDQDAALQSACAALEWASGPHDPLDRIAVSGLQGPILTSAMVNPEGLYTELLNDDGSVAAALPVAAASDGNGGVGLGVVVPVAPAAPFQGGPAQLRLVVDGQRCPAQVVQVNGLPEPADADQTLDALISSLEGLVAREAAAFGYNSMAEVEAAADDFVSRGDEIARTGDLGVPAQFVPLLLAADGIDTLKALRASGGLGSDDRRLFAAVVEAVGSQGYSTEVDTLLATLGQRTVPAPPASIGSGSVTPTVSAYSTGPSGACAQAIAGESIAIEDAFALNHYMKEQRDAEIQMDPTGSLQGAALGAVEGVLPVASILSGGAATAAGALLYVHKLIQLFTINTLPSEFTRLEPNVLVPGSTINEDFEAVGSPHWDEFQATATSRGMDLAGPTLEGVQTLLGAVGWAKDANAAGGTLTSDIAEFGADQLEGGARDAVWDVWGTLEQLASASDCFQLAPRDYGPIDITDREYSRASVDGTAFTLSDGGRNDTAMDLVHTGYANLNIEPRDDRFGGRPGSWAERIHVRELELEPDRYVVFASTLGTDEYFTVLPRYAERPDQLMLTVQPNPDVGSVVDPPSFNGSEFEFTYHTPDNESEYPVTLALSTEGTLPSGSPSGTTTRRAEIEITAEARVVVSPETDCIEPGESRQLTAQILGRNTPNFDWAITAGDGDLTGATAGNDPTVENNTYVAPGGYTDATVTVTHTDIDTGAEVSEAIDITVGDCDARVFVHGVLSASASAGGAEDAFNSDNDVYDLPDPVAPPTIPASLWLSRTEAFNSGQLNKTTTYTFYDSGSTCNTSDSNPSCDQVNVAGGGDTPASATANVSYSVDASGTSSVAFDFQGDQSCLEHPVTGNHYCSNGGGSASWTTAFYVDLAAPGQYELNIELDCTETGRAIGGVAFMAQIYRFAGGDGAQGDAMPVNGYPVGEIGGQTVFSPDGYPKYSQPTFSDGTPFSENACSNGTAVFSQVYDLAGPVQSGDPDLIYVRVDAQLTGSPQVNDNADALRAAAHPYRPEVPSDPTLLDPEVGSYSGGISVSGQASFRRVN